MDVMKYVWILQIVFVPTLIYQLIANMFLGKPLNPIAVFSLFLLIWAIPRYNPIWSELIEKWRK